MIGTVDLVVRKMNEAGEQKVWNIISSAANIHSYRREYATAIYTVNARPHNEIPVEDRYYCRKDRKGVCFDKAAMKITSKALGHNRISIITGHYIN